MDTAQQLEFLRSGKLSLDNFVNKETEENMEQKKDPNPYLMDLSDIFVKHKKKEENKYSIDIPTEEIQLKSQTYNPYMMNIQQEMKEFELKERKTNAIIATVKKSFLNNYKEITFSRKNKTLQELLDFIIERYGVSPKKVQFGIDSTFQMGDVLLVPNSNYDLVENILLYNGIKIN